MPVSLKRYIVSRDKDEIQTLIDPLLDFLQKKLRLTEALCICWTFGNQSGDMYRETMTYRQLVCNHRGAVWVHTVEDENAGGRALTVSVLTNLENREGDSSTGDLHLLTEFLDAAGYVSGHQRLQSRPMQNVVFRSYLDDVPALELLEAFQ